MFCGTSLVKLGLKYMLYKAHSRVGKKVDRDAHSSCKEFSNMVLSSLFSHGNSS